MFLTAFLLSALALLAPPVFQDLSQPGSVKDAQAALIDALARRDRLAFERVVAVDALFFLPALSQGREEVVKTWLPFLASQGPTLILTPADLVVAGSADLAYTTGTFAIAGQTDRGAITGQTGSFVASRPSRRLCGDEGTSRGFVIIHCRLQDRQ